MKPLIFLFVLGLFPAAGSTAASLAPVTVATAAGERSYRVEVADSEDEQQRGLMFRDSLPENGGMLFVYPRPQAAYMWMKNTRIPLDMLFIDADRRIAAMVEEAEPFDETPVGTAKPVIAAIELPGGAIHRDGLAIGDRVTYLLPEAR